MNKTGLFAMKSRRAAAAARDGSPMPRSMRTNLLTADGSMSVVRQDEDASNSGLLELGPALVHTPVLGAPAPGGSTSVRQPPPLLGKLRARGASSSDTDSSLVMPPPGAPMATRTRARKASSSSSDSSVIVHEEQAPTPWERAGNAPEASVPTGMTTTLPARLRRWMHDAMKQHLYETAIFWGQQVVALERALVVWALY